MHLFPPRFRCRVIDVIPPSLRPQPYEVPAATLGGVTFSVTDATVFVGLEWFDPCPDDPEVDRLLHGALDAVLESLE